jgi:large subunit ribosomal protein L29
MTTKEIAALSVEEITTKVREARTSLLNQNLRKQTGQVEKTHELRALRKDVARMETVLRQKKTTAAAS